MMQLLRYITGLAFVITGATIFSTAVNAAQIGIGTDQKIVQNPLELERIEIENREKFQSAKRIAEEKRISEEERIAEERAVQEAELKRQAEIVEAERLAKEKEREKHLQQEEELQLVASRTPSNVYQVESTAYTNKREDNHTYDGRVLTATGHDVTDSIYFNGLRIIAVDPAVIPLGAKVHLEGIGDAIALDTGGRINGHIVDLLVETKSEAIDWGRRHITVTLY